MPHANGEPIFDAISRKWLALAERPLLCFSELYRSGRWRHCYARREQFAAQMLEVVSRAKIWAKLARASRPAPGSMIHSRQTLAAAVVAAALLRPAAAADNDLKNGEELLQRDCASCHAIGRTGDSPQKEAPAFRTLGQRYPIESLEEALGEGIMSGHPDMPEFSFDADDVGDIIAYLKSIQQR